MGLEDELRKLRERIARLLRQSRDGPPPGSLDPSRLTDEELDRLDLLLRRARGEEITTAEEALAQAKHPGTLARNWRRSDVTPPPPASETGPLNDEEEAELEALVERCRVPEPWKEDE